MGTDKQPLSAEQQEAIERRAGRSQKKQAGDEESSATPRTLGTMIGEGGFIAIGKARYEVAAIPIAKLRQAGELINRLPNILVAHALAASQSEGKFSAQNTMGILAKLQAATADASPQAAVTVEYVQFALSSVPMQIDEDGALAMIEFTLLVLSRRHPQIESSRDEIAEELDIDTFLAVLCETFQRNSGLARRF